MRPAPEDEAVLAIRSAPRPVRRFSRKALAILLGGASFLVLASMTAAMSPGMKRAEAAPRELYSTSNKPTAEGLAALPIAYSAVRPAPPDLGPPLPGDLGPPILSAEREGRVQFSDVLEAAPYAGVDTAAIRAAEAAEVRTSGIFFAVGGTRAAGALSLQAPGGAALPPADPFAALARLAREDAAASASRGRPAPGEYPLATVADPSIYNPHRLEDPVSPWQVMAGTVIPAVLVTGINSDLPGQVIGQVTEPVHDTVTGRFVLIPQGAKLIGRYDNVIAFGQSRALVVWSRIIMPDGSSIRIENLPGTDTAGYAGLTDRVDHHTLQMFSAAALSSLISVGTELAEDDDRLARALRDAVQDGASRAGDEVLRRQLSVQPTITIRPGWRLRILVSQDLILRPYGDPS